MCPTRLTRLSGKVRYISLLRLGQYLTIRVYPYYDIVVWSQTHWRWLESKLVEIGMIGGERNYKISFVSDRTSMFPVFTQRDGQPFKHEWVTILLWEVLAYEIG